MFADKGRKLAEFMRFQAERGSQFHGFKPELGFFSRGRDVDVGGFVPFLAEKEEAERSNPQDCRHIAAPVFESIPVLFGIANGFTASVHTLRPCLLGLGLNAVGYVSSPYSVQLRAVIAPVFNEPGGVGSRPSLKTE
jgi:hypothetical protein